MFWQLQQTWEASTLQQRPQMQPEQNEQNEGVLRQATSSQSASICNKTNGPLLSRIPPGIWTPHRWWGPAGPTVTRAKMHRKCRDMQRLSDLYQEQCRDYQRFRRNVKKNVKIWKKKQKIQKIQKIWTKVMKIRKWSLCEVGRLKDSHSPQPWRGRLGHDAVGSAINGACSIARIRRWLWWLWWLPSETSWNFTARMPGFHIIGRNCYGTSFRWCLDGRHEIPPLTCQTSRQRHPVCSSLMNMFQTSDGGIGRCPIHGACCVVTDGDLGHFQGTSVFGTSFRTCFIPEPSFYPVRMFSFDPVPFPYVLMSSLWLGSHYSQLVWALCCRRKESNPGMFFPGPQGLSKNQMMTCTCCVMLLHA